MDLRGASPRSASGSAKAVDLILGQFQLDGFELDVELLRGSRAGDRGGYSGLPEQPGESDRAVLRARFGRNLIEGGKHVQTFVEEPLDARSAVEALQILASAIFPGQEPGS